MSNKNSSSGRHHNRVKRGLVFGLFGLWLLVGATREGAAHDDELHDSDHSSRYELQLKPGEKKEYNVTWAGQPLKANWIFLFNAKMDGDASAQVAMYAPNSETPFVEWDWAVNGQTHTRLAELPSDGFYRLAVANSGASPGAVDVSFQFDQSCECTAKLLDLGGGVLVFQQEVESGDAVRFEIKEPGEADFSVWAATRSRNSLTWKEGFDRVAQAVKSEKKNHYGLQRPNLGNPLFFCRIKLRCWVR